MSAEVLRRAASLMRERAEDARILGGEGRWRVDGSGYTVLDGAGLDVGVMSTGQEADHIASWHPAVALAVADWLTTTADEMDDADEVGRSWARIDACHAALAVARAYLGEQP